LVLQLLRTEQIVLFFTLLEDPVEHLVVEFGAFLKHWQSEGGLDITPVEEPVVQEEGRIC